MSVVPRPQLGPRRVPGTDRVKRLASDLVLGTKRGDGAAWCVIGPLGYRKADTGVDRLILIHQSFFTPRALVLKAVLTHGGVTTKTPEVSPMC